MARAENDKKHASIKYCGTTAAHHHQCSPNDDRGKNPLVQLALARGADPNCLCEINGLNCGATSTKSADALCISQRQAGRSSPRVIDLLIRWGARRRPCSCYPSRITKTLENGRARNLRYSTLAYVVYAPRFTTLASPGGCPCAVARRGESGLRRQITVFDG